MANFTGDNKASVSSVRVMRKIAGKIIHILCQGYSSIGLVAAHQKAK